MKHLFTLLTILLCLSANAQTQPFDVITRNDSTFVVSQGDTAHVTITELDQRIAETKRTTNDLNEENQVLLNILQNKRTIKQATAERAALQAVREKIMQQQSE